MIRIIVLILWYIAVCPLTARVSLDVTQTQWSHVLTWVWLIFGPGLWVLIFVFCSVIVSAIVMGLKTVFGDR